jgi:hypothetical protein
MLYLGLLAVALGFALGLARGGRIGNLLHLPTRWLWLALIPLALQVGLFLTPLGTWLGAWLGPVHTASYVLLLIPVLLNLALPGMRLIALGLVFNALVIGANGGFMPVAPEAMHAAGIGARLEVLESLGRIQKSILMTEDSRFALLADWIPLPVLGRVISPGDVVLMIGALWLISVGMVQPAANSTPRAARPG